MKKIAIILLTLSTLYASSNIDLVSVHNMVLKDKKVKCRLVCDKKQYKEKRIANAISFYKNSKYYKFSGDGF